MLKKLEKKRRVLELGVGAGVGTGGCTYSCRRRPAPAHRRPAYGADTVRLHILANSDTLEDQLVKLQVRDAVLAALPARVVTRAGTTTGAEAAAALRQALPALAAGRTSTALHRAHSPQAARLRLERLGLCRAGLRQLRPAGRALTPRCGWSLGEARKGRNWFCVLYPALCVSGCTSCQVPLRRPKTRRCLEGLR